MDTNKQHDDLTTTRPGYRYHTRRAVVLNATEAGLPTESPWVTLCLRHDLYEGHASRKAAGIAVHHADEWCSRCAHTEDTSGWVDGEKPPAVRVCACGFTGTRQAVAGHITRAARGA